MRYSRCSPGPVPDHIHARTSVSGAKLIDHTQSRASLGCGKEDSSESQPDISTSLFLQHGELAICLLNLFPPYPKMTVKIPLKAKLDILPALASVCLTIVYALIVGLFNRRAKTWYLHICYAVLRQVTRRLSPLQMQ